MLASASTYQGSMTAVKPDKGSIAQCKVISCNIGCNELLLFMLDSAWNYNIVFKHMSHGPACSAGVLMLA